MRADLCQRVREGLGCHSGTVVRLVPCVWPVTDCTVSLYMPKAFSYPLTLSSLSLCLSTHTFTHSNISKHTSHNEQLPQMQYEYNNGASLQHKATMQSNGNG